ncbi:DNA-binding protein snt1 [Marasmius crinis-equi]|uniref:DNA-binding protein snt1 n=1 Tax=Marasmius crinis-equi TaxID=585013 RepID=A0ABR3FV35_9AGAR
MSPASPYTRSREPSGGWRDPNVMATRIFEPSDSWKQNQRLSGGASALHPNVSMRMIIVAADLGHHTLNTKRIDTIAEIPTMEMLQHATDTPPIVPNMIKRLRIIDRARILAPLIGQPDPLGEAVLEEDPNHAPPIVTAPPHVPVRDHAPGLSRAPHPGLVHTPVLAVSHEEALGLARVYDLEAHVRILGSSLAKRYIDSEASTPARFASPPVAQGRSGMKSITKSTGVNSVNTEKIQPQKASNGLRPNSTRPSLLSRSPSHSSIASSRETSVKPSAPMAIEADTSVPSPATDVKNSALLSKSESECPPQPKESTVLPQDLKEAGPCSIPEVPTNRKTDDTTERDRVPEVKAQGLPTDKEIQPMEEATPGGRDKLSQTQAIENGTAMTVNGLSSQHSTTNASGVEGGDSRSHTPPPISQPPTSQTHTVLQLVPDFGPEDIPNMADATSVREALRVVVMTRLLADRQTRVERVEPILVTNLSLPRYPHDKITADKPAPELLIAEVMHPEGARARARNETRKLMNTGLVEKFEARQAALKNKVQRLKEEYLSLHEKWIEHCARLDEQAKAKQGTNPPETPNLNSVLPPATGRTTRRSAATMGDAVRSDFEMEQIIASIGYDEATDPNQLCVRNLAAIPDMISVTHGQVDYVYDDNNLRVDNPAEYYAPDTGIHDWTEEEKQVFLDKFAAYPKQFGIIAKYLPNKTAAQCVDFYYLHKKVNIDFRNVVAMNAPGRKGKRRTGKRKGGTLLADIRKHDAEVGPTTRGKGKRTTTATSVSLEVKKSRKVGPEDTPTTATPTPEPESRPRRRRAAASSGISGKSSLAVVTTEVEEEAATEDTESISRPAKRAKRSRKVKSAAIVNDDGSEGESKSTEAETTGRRRNIAVWSDDDKDLFLKLLGQHGDDFKRISASMPNKTTAQVTNFYRNNLDKLGLREIVKNAPRTSPVPASQRLNSPLMASLPLDDDDAVARDAQSAATSVSATPVPPDAAALGQPVPMHRRELSSVSGYSSYTTPYGAPAPNTVPMSVYANAPKPYHTSGYGAVAYGTYGASTPGVYPNGAYASTRSAYYPYPYSYTVPAGPYAGSTPNFAAAPNTTNTATSGTPNPYADPRYYPYTS